MALARPLVARQRTGSSSSQYRQKAPNPNWWSAKSVLDYLSGYNCSANAYSTLPKHWPLWNRCQIIDCKEACVIYYDSAGRIWTLLTGVSPNNSTTWETCYLFCQFWLHQWQKKSLRDPPTEKSTERRRRTPFFPGPFGMMTRIKRLTRLDDSKYCCPPKSRRA